MHVHNWLISRKMKAAYLIASIIPLHSNITFNSVVCMHDFLKSKYDFFVLLYLIIIE